MTRQSRTCPLNHHLLVLSRAQHNAIDCHCGCRWCQKQKIPANDHDGPTVGTVQARKNPLGAL
jgi:hypothetical protein